jgi:MOSC domain-containing protein YiiM
MAASATIVSLNVSPGGVPKVPVASAQVGVDGMEGDRQKHRMFHGGPDRALCLYSVELIEALRAEGHPINPGATGENVTIGGIDWRDVTPGARLELGDVEIEITGYAVPCKSIQGAFKDARSVRISHKLYPGWSRAYARVIRPGVLRVGDEVSLSRPAQEELQLG